MSYETVEDVLNRAREFHRLLGDFYHRAEDVVEKQRVKMVLEYLSRHEKRMEECLADYEAGAASSVVDTWYKYTPDKATCKCFEGVEVRPDMSAEEVIRMALRFDNCLVELYKGMAESAVSEAVKKVFTELLDLERSDEQKLSRDIGEMEDL